MQQLLNQLLTSTAFDIIQIEDNAMGGYQYRPPAPKVLTEHEVRIAPSGASTLRLRGVARRLFMRGEARRWRRYQPATWRRFTRIQVFTPQDASAISALAPDVADRVRVNPFGMDLPPAPDPALEVPDSLLFVGGFAHPPNVEAALWLAREIMPRLSSSRPGAHLTIVGDQPPAAVRALASDWVAVTGRVPAVEPYLRRTAVVVAPLHSGGGMRLKVLEAMAYGKGVVTTPLGAAGLVDGSGASALLIAADADQFADAVCTLLQHPDQRRQLGADARAFVARHHSNEAYVARLEALYEEVVPSA